MTVAAGRAPPTICAPEVASGPSPRRPSGTFPPMALLDWYGCATYRLRTAGLTIFLDAYIDRAPGAPGTGLTRRRHRRV